MCQVLGHRTVQEGQGKTNKKTKNKPKKQQKTNFLTVLGPSTQTVFYSVSFGLLLFELTREEKHGSWKGAGSRGLHLVIDTN